MTAQPDLLNAAVWRKLYAEGKNDLRYPSDVLVRLGARLLSRNEDRRLLDFGFGTGANLLHFARQSYEMYGIEISEHALALTQQRVREAGLAAELSLIEPGHRTPYRDSFFDAVYAWQVLYYGDKDVWRRTVSELERVTRPGGRVIVATAAPGDISQAEAEPLGNEMYRSRVPSQEGCVLTIPEQEGLAALFAGRGIEVGEFGFRFGPTVARHWIVTYRKPRS